MTARVWSWEHVDEGYRDEVYFVVVDRGKVATMLLDSRPCPCRVELWMRVPVVSEFALGLSFGVGGQLGVVQWRQPDEGACGLVDCRWSETGRELDDGRTLFGQTRILVDGLRVNLLPLIQSQSSAASVRLQTCRRTFAERRAHLPCDER